MVYICIFFSYGTTSDLSKNINSTTLQIENIKHSTIIMFYLISKRYSIIYIKILLVKRTSQFGIIF